VVHAEDITERKRNEKALYESEEKYRSIFENAVEGIFQSTPEGRFISANPATAHMHGYDSPEEMITSIIDIGKQLWVDPEERMVFSNLLDNSGTVKNFESQFHKKNGTTIWVSLSTRTVKDAAGKILYYEGIVEDITSRKLAEEELKATTEKLRKNLARTIRALSVAVETRDPYTAGHQKKVSGLAGAIAQGMGLPRDAVEHISLAGTIHDIGKISVPAEILAKPGKLSALELGIIKVHPQAGYDILKDVDLSYPIAEMILQHHERLDGSGYPQGLKDGQILLGACILAVADVVEAISSHRPYRPGLGIDAALKEIEQNKGVLYNADVVEVCLELFKGKGFKFE
jgi:PAS domain S-box-containing protein